MAENEHEEKLLRSVALQNARSILLARRRAEEELARAKEALERKSAELAHSLARLRVTLSSIGDAVITTDTQGRVTSLNPVAVSLTGWAQDEAAGQPLDAVFRIVDEQTRQPVENRATTALREGVIVGLANHTVLITKDGAERPIDDSAAPNHDEHGQAVGCVLIFRDVTEKRGAEEAPSPTATWTTSTRSGPSSPACHSSRSRIGAGRSSSTPTTWKKTSASGSTPSTPARRSMSSIVSGERMASTAGI